MADTQEKWAAAGMAERKKPYVRWTFYASVACLLLLLGLCGGVAYLALSPGGRTGHAAGAGLKPELRRELAGRLLAAGLADQAIEQYRRYLEEARVPPDQQGQIAYTIGKLCMDRGRYEEALSWLYQVEILHPQTELAAETGSKIVACLERLGKYTQAEYALQSHAAPSTEKASSPTSGAVAARIGRDAITAQEVLEALDALPDWMRESFREPARKEDFLKQYVAEELLFRKAKKLELDKDPRIRLQADRALRQLLIRKVLESEVEDKVRISEEDIELYYRANRDRYQEKEGYKIRFMRIPKEQVREVQEALKRGEDFASLARARSLDHASRAAGGEVREWIVEGLDPTGLGDPGRLWKALSALGKPGIAGPVETPQGVFLFEIVDHRPQRDLPLEQVKARVKADLYQERIEKAYQDLVSQAFAASDVQIFPEALGKAEGSEKSKGGAAPAVRAEIPGPSVPSAGQGSPEGAVPEDGSDGK